MKLAIVSEQQRMLLTECDVSRAQAKALGEFQEIATPRHFALQPPELTTRIITCKE
jgi:hypothetical protein